MTDEPLFDLPDMPQRSAPKGTTPTPGKVSYKSYDGPQRCEWCAKIAYEKGLRREHAPSILTARFERKVGKKREMLCAPHKNEAQLLDVPATQARPPTTYGDL